MTSQELSRLFTRAWWELQEMEGQLKSLNRTQGAADAKAAREGLSAVEKDATREGTFQLSEAQRTTVRDLLMKLNGFQDLVRKKKGIEVLMWWSRPGYTAIYRLLDEVE